ncbi:hypothetical protein ACFQ1R_00895 [Mariniflexile jejuense]|uniref:Acetyltransferase (GNAT) family protein n=1 Tax=Mariniflexile jejuense TaxID=1173582 RepID=A0ABW3JGF1_9FLAO
MYKLVKKAKVFLNMVLNGLYKDIFNIIKQRIYSNTYWFYIRRDLTQGINNQTHKAKIDITLREYTDADHKYFKNLPLDDMLINANIPTCYVAVTKDGIPCFREWFIEPSQNEKIKKFFVNNLPQLKPDECIFERAFAVKAYRGLDLYQEVNYLFAKKALNLGYKWSISCIDLDNILSLKAAHKLQTTPTKLLVIKHRFFTQKPVLIDIPKKLKAKTPWLFDEENEVKV